MTQKWPNYSWNLKIYTQNLKNGENTHVTSKITKNTLNPMKITKIAPNTSKWPK